MVSRPAKKKEIANRYGLARYILRLFLTKGGSKLQTRSIKFQIQRDDLWLFKKSGLSDRQKAIGFPKGKSLAATRKKK